MSKKINKEYSRRGKIAFNTAKIKELIYNGKLCLAKKMINELIVDYPYDEKLRKEQARLLTIEKKYDEAIEVLESFPKGYLFNRLAGLYLKMGYDNKLYEIYKEFYTKDKEYMELENRWLQIYLRKLFDKEGLSKSDLKCYMEEQIYKYDEKKALDHIKNKHKEIKEFNEEKTHFNSNIDIDKKFYEIKNYIEKNLDKGQLYRNAVDVYLIECKECGEEDGTIKNYIKVITLINTSNIITMFPVTHKLDLEVCKIDENNSFKDKLKVKSGIDRFNERYKKIVDE